MKTQGILLNFCMAFFVFLPAGATVWTVSNNPNIPAQFTNINTAITGATDGDTIYIHGSTINYGQVTLIKRVVLIGPGHKPKTADSRVANINGMLLNKKGNNSEISGLVFLSPISPQGGYVLSDTVNLSFNNCLFANSILTISFSFTNFVIENCIFTNGYVYFYNVSGYNVRKGLVIRNNIFGTWAASGGASIHNPIDNSIIDHNIFLGSYSYGTIVAYTGAQNCTFSNNIFYGRSIDSTAATNCVFLNNLTYNCSYNKLPLPGNTGSGNLVGQNPLFINFPGYPADFSYQQNLRLEAGSPGKVAGTDGTDLGVYGGPIGFSMTGEPIGYPVVRSMDIYNATVPPGGILDIRIKSTIPVKN